MFGVESGREEGRERDPRVFRWINKGGSKAEMQESPHALFKSYLPFSLDEIDRVIGEGGFGCSVYGSSELNPTSKALVKIARIDTKAAEKEFLREIDIHETLHLIVPLNVPDFVGVDHLESFPVPFRKVIAGKCPELTDDWKRKKWQGEFYFVAMSLGEQGSLDNMIDRHTPFSTEYIRSFTFQVLFTLARLSEEKKFIHNDLKPGNLVLTSLAAIAKQQPYLKKFIRPNTKSHIWEYRWKGWKSWNVPIFSVAQLIDFGLSEFLTASSEVHLNGTAPYISPDSYILDRDSRSPLTDLWSLGCIILEMATSTVALSKKYKYGIKEDDHDGILGYIEDTIEDHDAFQEYIDQFSGQDQEELTQLAVASIITALFGNPLLLHRNTFKSGYKLNRVGLFLTQKKWHSMIRQVWTDFSGFVKDVKKRLLKALTKSGFDFVASLCNWRTFTEPSMRRFLSLPWFKSYAITNELMLVNGKPEAI